MPLSFIRKWTHCFPSAANNYCKVVIAGKHSRTSNGFRMDEGVIQLCQGNGIFGNGS